MTGADGSAIELRVMRTSAAINKGNSGGGIYDANGRLVGIVVAKRTGHEVDNMGYAIPINLARNLAENIIYFCSDGTKTGVQRPLIGITITAKVIGVTIDEETGEVVKSERIEISELSDTCIAKDKVKAGDVINSISVDGVTVKVTRLFHVLDHMLTARVGSEVKLNVTRGEETIEVTFTVPETAFNTMK
jgi:serine protease Do